MTETFHKSIPIPYSWYVESEIFQLEKLTIFNKAPQYLGLSTLIPEIGSFHTIPQLGHTEMLVRDNESISLMSNVCLHRGSVINYGSGHNKRISCPLHRWSYKLDGELVKTPHYKECPNLRLLCKPTVEWNGILFSQVQDINHDLYPLNSRVDLDVSNYLHFKSETLEQEVNWKIPIEVFLENYHAPYIHPGFTRYASPEAWYGNEGTFDSETIMFQEMKPNLNFRENPASKTFDKWQKLILKISKGNLPKFAALVGLYFPNIIIEWWPFMFLVSVYEPRGPLETVMYREFYFDPQVINLYPEYPEVALEAWYETQQADDEAHIHLQLGRTALSKQNGKQISGYPKFQFPMETSVEYFHELLIKQMDY